MALPWRASSQIVYGISQKQNATPFLLSGHLTTLHCLLKIEKFGQTLVWEIMLLTWTSSYRIQQAILYIT